MNIGGAVRIFTIFFSMMVFFASVSCAPSYNPEYDNNLREILEMLVQRDAASMEDRLGLHQVSRKSSRSPQLRLRFGKRPDATFPVPAYLAGGLTELDN